MIIWIMDIDFVNYQIVIFVMMKVKFLYMELNTLKIANLIGIIDLM